MACIPPSAPHLLWLARPRALCHTNSISYESGVDISPPGKTDDTFHYTFIQLQRLVCQTAAKRSRKGMSENPVGQGRNVLVLILHFLFFSVLFCHLPPSSHFFVSVIVYADQAQPVHSWLHYMEAGFLDKTSEFVFNHFLVLENAILKYT